MASQFFRLTTLYLILLVIVALENKLVNTVEVSAQIDLNSQEDLEVSSNAPVKTIVNVRQDDDRFTLNPRSQRFSPFRSTSTGLVSNGNDLKRRRSHQFSDDSTKQPTIVNNIQIVINGSRSLAEVDSCKNGICDVTASSTEDQNGNIVTNIRLTIVTKANKVIKVPDVPVFNGVRGVETTRPRLPDFNLLNHPNSRPHLYNNVPQIQIRHQDPNEVWFENRRSFQRPSSTWFYHRIPVSPDSGFRDHRDWYPSKPVVDDKIEPPLSKTNRGNE